MSKWPSLDDILLAFDHFPVLRILKIEPNRHTPRDTASNLIAHLQASKQLPTCFQTLEICTIFDCSPITTQEAAFVTANCPRFCSSSFDPDVWITAGHRRFHTLIINPHHPVLDAIATLRKQELEHKKLSIQIVVGISSDLVDRFKAAFSLSDAQERFLNQLDDERDFDQMIILIVWQLLRHETREISITDEHRVTIDARDTKLRMLTRDRVHDACLIAWNDEPAWRGDFRVQIGVGSKIKRPVMRWLE
jgi:hypothetical protein